MDDIRECWAQELVPGCYHFRDPVLDQPEEPATPPAPEPEPEDVESLI